MGVAGAVFAQCCEVASRSVSLMFGEAVVRVCRVKF